LGGGGKDKRRGRVFNENKKGGTFGAGREVAKIKKVSTGKGKKSGPRKKTGEA